MGSEVYPME